MVTACKVEWVTLPDGVNPPREFIDDDRIRDCRSVGVGPVVFAEDYQVSNVWFFIGAGLAAISIIMFRLAYTIIVGSDRE